MTVVRTSGRASTRRTRICTSPPISRSTTSRGRNVPGRGGAADLAIHGAFLDSWAAETHLSLGGDLGVTLLEVPGWWVSGCLGVFLAGQVGRSTRTFVHPGVGASPGCAGEGEGTATGVRGSGRRPHSCRRRSEPLSLSWRLSCPVGRLGSQPEARR